MEFLRGKKTYIVSILMVLVSLVHMVTGEMTLVEFAGSPHLQTLLEATGLASLRAGIKKAELP